MRQQSIHCIICIKVALMLTHALYIWDIPNEVFGVYSDQMSLSVALYLNNILYVTMVKVRICVNYVLCFKITWK